MFTTHSTKRHLRHYLAALTYRAILCITSLIVSIGGLRAETINYMTVLEKSKPFQINDGTKSQGGLVTEIVEAIFSGTDYQLHTHIFPVARIYYEIESRNHPNWIAYDAKVWNSLIASGEFVESPLFTVNHALLTCNPTIQNIGSAEDIQGWTLATLKQFQYLELDRLADQGRVKLQQVDRYEAGIQMAARSHVQGFVEMALRLKYNLRQLESPAPCLHFVDFSALIPPFDIYLSVDRKMSDKTKAFILHRIEEMKRTHQLEKLLAQWH
ncbi:MAG: hypothetical protein H7A00_11405 [Hahellaceae bacterium]|nr:hypothetical protein [Hahellaceae bacterium]